MTTLLCRRAGTGDDIVRISIKIPDSLWKEARRVAFRDGVTVRELVEQGLRQVLQQRNRPARFKLRNASFKGKGLSAYGKKSGWERLRT